MKIENVASKVFSKSSLFKNVDSSSVECFIKKFHRGENISEIQDGEACLGIVASGEVKVHSVSYNGEALSVSTLREGNEFGICNVFLKNDMPTVLNAKVASTVLFMKKSAFVELLKNDSELMLKYLTLCNEKMQFLATRIELMGLKSCKAKLACFLIRNVDDFGKVHLNISKEQLSESIGVSRTSLFRTLSELESEKIIKLDTNTVEILDLNKLKNVT